MKKRLCGRFCVNCGSKLLFYKNLSNPKAPNEYRILVYACPSCTKSYEKPTLISIQQNDSDDPLKTVFVQVTKLRKKS